MPIAGGNSGASAPNGGSDNPSGGNVNANGGNVNPSGGNVNASGGNVNANGGNESGAAGSGGVAAPNASGGAAGASLPNAGSPAVGGSAGTVAALEPAAGDYGQRRALPEANSEMAVAEANGKIYVLGGYPSSRVVQSTFQVYDVASDTWSKVAPYPVTIHHPVLAGVNGRVYSLGGQTSLQGVADTALSMEYDPAADEWRELTAMPTARGAGAGAVIDDKIYVVGGRPPAANAFEVYDIGDNAWTALPDLPQAFPDRNHLAAATLGGKIYVTGGRYAGGSFSDPMTDSLDIYDPQTQLWSAGAKMPRPRGGVNGVAALGCLYVWGGEGTNTGEPNDVFPDHDVYNPLLDRWTRLTPLPTPIHGVTGAAFVDGLIYMPGGGTRSGGSSGSSLFQVYRPEVSCE